MDEPLIHALVAEVRRSPKYRTVTSELIARIGRRELQARRNFKDAVKSTKELLHRSAGAYISKNLDYAKALQDITATKHDTESLKGILKPLMATHASTRERLPILEEFYSTALLGLGPISSIMDLACGLNPLCLPWMPGVVDAHYYACDVYEDMMDFIAGFFEVMGVSGSAEARDIIGHPPHHHVDLALMLKIIPCMEQSSRGAGASLIDSLNARHILVSFPVKSLGGREKGMAGNYERSFMALAQEKDWAVRRFEFPTELGFLISKPEVPPCSTWSPHP